MIDRRTVFEIHRLQDAGYSARQIARQLRLCRKTVRKYLAHPEQSTLPRKPRASKLDPYRETIKEFLAEAPDVKAPVVLQRLREKGFDGRSTIVRSYLQSIREKGRKGQAVIRFESLPGKQLQIDWGHFGSLTYGTARRKLYALAVIEAYSRMLYVEFTHSQKQEALHQGLVNAFHFLHGTTEELIVDNMLTAVTERCGNIIRFNDAFLDFLRVFKIVPHACNIRAPREKGKIEKSIDYLRRNFWPLRSFTDLDDVQRQVNQWRDAVCNVRIHQTTGQRPVDRFSRVTLRPLPSLLPDCRETASLLVHQDFAVYFDGNSYTAPPWTIGRYITVKADQTKVTLYHKQKQIAAHPRTWERKKRIELPAHREQVEKFHRTLWQDRDIALLASLGQEALDYLAALAEETRLPIKKNAAKLLELKDQYGPVPLLNAVKKAMAYKAYGADYIENILRQEQTPQKHHPPVKLKNDELNTIRLPEPSLADYDAYILKTRQEK